MSALDECDHLISTIHSSQPTELSSNMRVLVSAYTVLGVALGRSNIFWRGRRCSSAEGYANASELSYPPPVITPVGRLNDVRSPCLYASTRRTTLLTELGVQDGEFVHLIGLRVKPDAEVRFAAVGEYFNVYKTGRTRVLPSKVSAALNSMLNACDPTTAMPLLYIDAFLSELLADKGAAQNEYARSRAVAAELYRKAPLTEAIFYPSVQDHVGMNVAFLPAACDSKIQPVCSQVVRINRVRSFGFYDYEICREAVTIDDNRDFVWQTPSGVSQTSLSLFGLTDKEAEFVRSAGGVLDGDTYLQFIKHSSRLNAAGRATRDEVLRPGN